MSDIEDQDMSEFQEYVLPTTEQPFDPQPLEEKVRLAKGGNPAQVMIVGYQETESTTYYRISIFQGYWCSARLGAPTDKNIARRIDPRSNRWRHKNYPFDIISGMDKSQAALVTGNTFFITAAMLRVEEGHKVVVAFRWLYVMHSVISPYPSHFLKIRVQALHYTHPKIGIGLSWPSDFANRYSRKK
ncbi:hypothetical protein BCON_0199g00250 [Botryotinia convoluta]|uniref:Uncharacterized protein n=1 Tax=Botryotinia convoluta TaxID=54673 RepID=A0A4Z1HR85_9HELO|nr:hypothetical protein BCON_0199g00250 [Botryotinia convoluta]